MRYTLLFTSLLMFVMVTYYIPQVAEAQTSNRERCNAEICNVKITKDGFVPKTMIVKIGTIVVWTNTDDGRHTVTSGSPGEIFAPLKSLLLEKGNTYEFTFYHAELYEGSYKYFDQVTRTMRGEIIVEQEEEKMEDIPETHTMKIDFDDPESGVKNVSLPNGSIKSMEIDPDFHSLTMTLENVKTIGKLKITLDRNLIDSKNNGNDDHFVALIDGEEGFYDEMSSTPIERTLQIVVPSNAKHLEIVGTQALPEFPIARLLIVGIFTAMIAAYRLRMRFFQT